MCIDVTNHKLVTETHIMKVTPTVMVRIKNYIFVGLSASYTNIKTNMNHWLTLYVPELFRDIYDHTQHEHLPASDSILTPCPSL
jgi:hypothetical protein